MGDVNGLPVEVFAVLCGIGVVILAWVLMRFGGKIAKGVLVLAGIVLAGIVVLAALTQAGANFEQSRATVEVAKVAQTANTSNLLLVGVVGVVGCVGVVAVVAVLALVGVALYLWYQNQQTEKRHRGYPPIVQVAPQGQPAQMAAGDFDLAWIEDENWVKMGEQLWKSNESLHW